MSNLTFLFHSFSEHLFLALIISWKISKEENKMALVSKSSWMEKSEIEEKSTERKIIRCGFCDTVVESLLGFLSFIFWRLFNRLFLILLHFFFFFSLLIWFLFMSFSLFDFQDNFSFVLCFAFGNRESNSIWWLDPHTHTYFHWCVYVYLSSKCI